jgi:hypothetical protein
MLIVVLGSLLVLQRYVIGYDPTSARAGDLVVRLLEALREVYVVSIMIAAALSLFATLRLARRVFVPVISLAVLWTALLVGGVFLLPEKEGVPAAVVPAVPEGQVIRAGDYRLYAPRREGLRLTPLLVDTIGRQPGIELFPEAVIDVEQQSIIVPGRPDIVPDLTRVETSYPTMVRPPEQMAPLVRDVRAVNQTLGLAVANNTASPGGAAGSRSALVCAALGVFLLSCWTLVRLTRWPLFNAALVFLALRLVLWLISSVNGGRLADLVTAAIDSSQLGTVTAAAVAFIAAVLFIILAILPSFGHWKREVGHE